jgi:two-component system, LytTR family, response regulator AlgR
MKILIVDDEALARQRLRQLIARLPSLEVQAVDDAVDADQAWQRVAQASAETVPDVVLLDIRMLGPTARAGLHLARRLRGLARPPAVIFVTAHAEHALKAFELEAVDYLTKPVRLERLQAALQRVQVRLQTRLQTRLQSSLQSSAVATNESVAVNAAEATLVITERGRVLRLPLAELLYLRAEQKLVLVRSERESHLVDDSLAELELRLQPWGDSFIRVHRNALVALRAIRALELREMPADGPAAEPGPDSTESWAVRVAPLDEWLAVSRRQVAAVKLAVKAEVKSAE